MSGGDSSIKLYLANWHQTLPVLQELSAILSPAEHERAALFHKKKYSEKFIACRILLKKILAEETGLAPEEVEICYAEHGKPYLKSKKTSDVKFSISHSGNMCFIGISHGREIGVDLEKIRPLDHENLSARFYSKTEISFYKSIEGAEQELAFFKIWTRKEACAKANGCGLRFKISDLNTGIPEDQSVAFIPGLPKEPLLVQNVVLADGFMGAVAVEGKDDFKYRLSNFWI